MSALQISSEASCINHVDLNNCGLDSKRVSGFLYLLARRWQHSVSDHSARDRIFSQPGINSEARPPITALDLGNNNIGFMGASIIAMVLKIRPWHPVRMLNLRGTFLGTKGCQSFVSLWNTDVRLVRLYLKQTDFLEDSYLFQNQLPPHIRYFPRDVFIPVGLSEKLGTF